MLISRVEGVCHGCPAEITSWAAAAKPHGPLSSRFNGHNIQPNVNMHQHPLFCVWLKLNLPEIWSRTPNL